MSCFSQPIRLILKQRFDVAGGQWLVHVIVLQGRDTDPQLAGHLWARVRSLAAQRLQPDGRILLQLNELLMCKCGILELLRGCRKINAQLLGGSGGLHGRAGFVTRVRISHDHHSNEAPIISPMPDVPASQKQQSARRVFQPKRQARHLKVVFSTGVQPDKWFGRFDERVPGWKIASAGTDDPLAYIRSHQADVALVRLPAAGYERPADMHEVALYEEQVGVAAPKEHPVKLMDAIDYQELTDEKLMYITPSTGWDDVVALREALQVVAANVGIAVAPRPLLRALNQRGVVHRDLFGIDATTCPRTRVALMWLTESDSDVIQDFVGICKGRTAGSSRQTAVKGRSGVNKKAAKGGKTGKKKGQKRRSGA